MIILAGLALALGGAHGLMESMGRDASMSGRTDIWPAALRAVSDPIIGAGFEGFWLSPNVHIFQKELLDKGYFPSLVAVLNEAHNGYIEIYLNLGLIGVGLLATILVSGYLNAVESIQRNREFGAFILASTAVAVVYGITEASFRTMSPSRVFLLMALLCGAGIAKGRLSVNSVGPRVSRGAYLQRLPEAKDHTAGNSQADRPRASGRALPTVLDVAGWAVLGFFVGLAALICGWVNNVIWTWWAG
jgi:O-antigen ligase